MNAITEHRSLADGFADEAIESFSRSHVHIIDTMNRLRVLPQQLAARGLDEGVRASAAGVYRFFNDAVLEHHDEEERELFPSLRHSASPGDEAGLVQSLIARLEREHRELEAMWDKIKFQLDWLHTERGLGIILLAHIVAVKISPPDAPSYERWEPSVCEFARDLLCDWCQEVFFGSFRTYAVKEDTGFNRTRNIAAGGSERFVRTQPTAGVRAKNRLNMPEEMVEFSFEKYAEFFVPTEVLKGN
jgi:hypothetical protein